MAIAIHASSPAGASNNVFGPIVSPSFSPPAGSLLVAIVMAFDTSTLSNSGTARTWTKRATTAFGGIAIWTAPNPTALTNITVTSTGTGGALWVRVITGQHATSPIGASGTGTSTTNNATITGYTSTGAESRGFCVAGEYNDLGLPTSTDDRYAANLDIDALCLVKAANTPTPGTAVTFNLDAGGTGAASWDWAALEILPDSLSASVNLTTVAIPVTVPAPAVSAGAGATLATVPVPVTVPAVSPSAGAGATLATVLVPVTIPPPAVTLDETEVVTPDTVLVGVAVPAPAASTSTAAQLGTVAVGVAVFAPDVDAEFNSDVVLATVNVAVAVDGAVASVPILPGDNLDGAPGQMEFNGFVIGRGTPYRWKNLIGWRDRPPVDSGNAPRPTRHGSWAGRPLAQERIVTLTGLLRVPAAEVEDAVETLEQALPVEETEVQAPLVINSLGKPYLIYGRIDRVQLPEDAKLRLGLGQLTLQWICSDPRRYAIDATGITVPVGETVNIGNGGNAATHPILRMAYPLKDPIIINAKTGRQTAFTITLTPGQQLTINCDLGTALVGLIGEVGGDDVMGELTGASIHPSDFVLARGNNPVSFDADTGGTTGLEVLYRDARL